MKKFILVTMLAVAASWLLSEPRKPGDGMAPLDAAFDGPKPREHNLKRVPNGLLVLDDGEARPAPKRPIRNRPDLPARKTSTGKPIPAWFPTTAAEEEATAKPDAFGSRVLLGRLSASEDRARQDLRKIVEQEVASWLAADVPPSWKVPAPVIDGMVQGRFVQELTKDLTPAPTPSEAEGSSTPETPGLDSLYTLYRAGQKLDFSPTTRAGIVGMYHRDLATARMQRLGGGLALALVGLAVLSGYIKADEATKGYYTNRLRLAAAAGLGAAGVAAYRFLV
jgi:hypothetical protein